MVDLCLRYNVPLLCGGCSDGAGRKDAGGPAPFLLVRPEISGQIQTNRSSGVYVNDTPLGNNPHSFNKCFDV
jgi:hypothetical protein